MISLRVKFSFYTSFKEYIGVNILSPFTYKMHALEKSFGSLQPVDIMPRQWILKTPSRIILYIFLESYCSSDSFNIKL